MKYWFFEKLCIIRKIFFQKADGIFTPSKSELNTKSRSYKLINPQISFMMLLLFAFLSKSFSWTDHKYIEDTFTYKVIDGKEFKLDKIADLSRKSNGRSPVFLYVHGGGFITDSRINILH